MLASVREGEPVPKRRPARNSDKLLVGRTVVVTLPAFGTQPSVAAKMLWETKGDQIEVELTEANLQYVIHALRASPPAPKRKSTTGANGDGMSHEKSPRKKRRLKKRPSEALAEEGHVQQGDAS